MKNIPKVAAIALLSSACTVGITGPSTTEATTTTTTAPATADTVAATTTTIPPGYCHGTGGTLIWAHDEEPPDLHLNRPDNGRAITAYLWQAMWEDLYGVSGDIDFYPELLAEEAEVTDNLDGSATVSFRLRDGLEWSDGEPLTSEDVEFTYDIIMEGYDPVTGTGAYEIPSRAGYDRITDFDVISDTEFDLTFEPFYSGYKTLFTNVFPAHAFGPATSAEDVNVAQTSWTNAFGETLPSSGPLLFDSWEQGSTMTLVRNDRYHGSVSPDVTNDGLPCIEEVRIDFIDTTDALIETLENGAADIVFTAPQLIFGRIAENPAFTVAALGGSTYEHWGFNLNDPHLSRPEVREAIALAIDKRSVISTLYEPLFGSIVAENGLGNTYWMNQQPAYEDHQAPLGYGRGNVTAARERLEAAGYVLGESGNYEHPDDGPLSLAVGTTGGDELRERQQQLLARQLGEAGIEVTIDNLPGTDYLAERPFSTLNLLSSASGGELGSSELVDIMQFAWIGGPWPGGQSAAYRSGTIVDGDDGPVVLTTNPYGYQNEAFDALADECDAATDQATAEACYNELDRYVTTLEVDTDQGLVVIPLTQVPDFFAYSNGTVEVAAVSPDVRTGGPLANVVDYILR